MVNKHWMNLHCCSRSTHYFQSKVLQVLQLHPGADSVCKGLKSPGANCCWWNGMLSIVDKKKCLEKIWDWDSAHFDTHEPWYVTLLSQILLPMEIPRFRTVGGFVVHIPKRIVTTWGWRRKSFVRITLQESTERHTLLQVKWMFIPQRYLSLPFSIAFPRSSEDVTNMVQ